MWKIDEKFRFLCFFCGLFATMGGKWGGAFDQGYHCLCKYCSENAKKYCCESCTKSVCPFVLSKKLHREDLPYIRKSISYIKFPKNLTEFLKETLEETPVTLNKTMETNLLNLTKLNNAVLRFLRRFLKLESSVCWSDVLNLLVEVCTSGELSLEYFNAFQDFATKDNPSNNDIFSSIHYLFEGLGKSMKGYVLYANALFKTLAYVAMEELKTDNRNYHVALEKVKKTMRKDVALLAGGVCIFDSVKHDTADDDDGKIYFYPFGDDGYS